MANQPIKMDTGDKVLLFISAAALLVAVLFLVSQLAGFLGRVALPEPSEVEQERVAERIAPIGVVVSGDVEAVEEVADLSPGDIYSNVCAACHDTGVSDAPIKGDTDAWAARLEDKGLDTLFDNSINGIGAMPARGGDPSLSDEDLRKVVAYMLDESDVDHGWTANDVAVEDDDPAAVEDEPVAEDEPAVEEDDRLAGIPMDDGDVGRGESLYGTCIACHGAQGQGQAVFPKIAGNTAEYIAEMLVRYRAGETVGGDTALMAPNARGLSDQDIADLSVYVATFED